MSRKVFLSISAKRFSEKLFDQVAEGPIDCVLSSDLGNETLVMKFRGSHIDNRGQVLFFGNFLGGGKILMECREQ